jgi:hypothetical protein
MAPELLKEVDESDEMPDLRKADIFSLGVTVYELMIGKLLILTLTPQVMNYQKMDMSGIT